MKTRESNEEFAERIRHLPRLERKRLIDERMTPEEHEQLFRDSLVAFVGLVLIAVSPFIF
jgi:hypothetical protein